jgi:predicted AAA+ superfamily ATPase
MIERWIDISKHRSCLINGPRRSGKTTLLRSRFHEWRYATLDDLDYLAWAGKDPKGFVESLGQRAVIDEIQRLPLLTVAVKYAIDNEKARFVMTGSSSIGLLDATADTLAGRIDIHSLPTACWGEDLGAPTHSIFKGRIGFEQLMDAQRRLPEAIQYGQFPEVLIQDHRDRKRDILVNYRNTYFTRDLMQLANIENLDGLLAILHHLVRSLGSHLDVSNFAREAGISHPTAKKYLNALHQSHLTFKLYGYQYGPAKRHIKAAKTYFADNGIISSLSTSVSEGQLMENFVLAELEKRRKLGLIPVDSFFYYKSSGGHEIDLVFEQAGTVHAVEIKATRKPGSRDLTNLKRFSDPSDREINRYLFYMGEDYATEDGVHLIPIAALFRGK